MCRRFSNRLLSLSIAVIINITQDKPVKVVTNFNKAVTTANAQQLNFVVLI